jgi:outer membrane protein assembly factor BamB
MSASEAADLLPRKPLRLWPGVAAALVVLIMRFVVPTIVPDLLLYGIFAALGGFAVIVLWWLFFSRAAWPERLAALALMIVATVVTKQLVHESIENGAMGMMVFVLAIPSTLSLAFVAWAVATRGLPTRTRRVTMVAAIFVGCLVWTLARTEGITGAGTPQLKWRWSPTPEQRLLAQTVDPLPGPAPAAPVAVAPLTPPTSAVPVATEGQTPPAADPRALPSPAAMTAGSTPAAADPRRDPHPSAWSGFRGPGRDSIIRDSRIATDWTASPPVQLWRRPIGPGWSSFAVQGDRIYTQEQRGEEEVVAAYDLKSGKPVWAHKDPVRFWESNGGAGPRATPEISDGRVYTVGATGIVNALDAATGRKLWSRTATDDTGGKLPYWAFTSSPVVTHDLVIIYAGGLVAYDRATGAPRWVSQTRRGSYSSPHPVTIAGVEQLVQQNGAGAFGISPVDGSQLWEFAWEGTPIVQPAVIDSDLLIATGDSMGGLGLRRIALAQQGGTWTATERWHSRGLKPYFNDFLVHKGHAYGFDASILACLELEGGERKWKGGRYGQGQMLLLADQDLLLVLAEEGDLALVAAKPDGFAEVARVKGIEGKTWNHPVLVGDILLVRNGEEMAAFRLAQR